MGASAFTITGNFTTQFQLTTIAGSGGTVTPASGAFFDASTTANINAIPNSGFTFANWTGPVVGSATTASNTVLMDAAKSVTANFSAVQGVAPDVTAQLTVTRGAVVVNRATGRYLQSVTIGNNGAALASAAYVLDNLAAGYTLFAPSGQTLSALPAGNSYKEIGALGVGATVTFSIELTRVGTPVLTYTPRVLGNGPR